VEVEDSPGILADIAQVIKNYGANITHLAVYRGETGKCDVVVRANTLNCDDIIKEIENHGYRVTQVLKKEP